MQSARGTTSHFNISQPRSTTRSSASWAWRSSFNTLAMMLFLCIIRRDTPPQRAGYLWGIRLGVAMFLLASLAGRR